MNSNSAGVDLTMNPFVPKNEKDIKNKNWKKLKQD